MTSTSSTPETKVCTICGKTLTREQSLEGEIGPRCEALLKEGWTAEKLQAHRKAMQMNRDEIPSHYIKLSVLDKKVKAERENVPGLTIGKMVKAIGRDRGTSSPLHPIATPIYDERNHRWVDKWLQTKSGLKAIATGDFSKAPARK